MRIKLTLLLLLCMALPTLAATGLTGMVVDARNGKPVADANIVLRGQGVFVVSGADGRFTISNAQPGETQLDIIAYGYDDFSQDVTVKSGIVADVGTLRLTPTFDARNMTSDDQMEDQSALVEDEGLSQSIGTIQGATNDVYYQTANYNFSTVRFRIRGYEANWNAGYINGFDYNDAMRGRFNYSGLGGMTSSAFRNKTVEVDMDNANFGFGRIGGSTNFTTYASEYAPGFRGNVSYTNSNYMLRAMLQYNTGVTKNGWAFSASVIGRYAPEGVIEGTFYNSFGYALSLQKIFNDKHSINISTWGAPTERATNAAATQEAYDLAGSNLYNPSWGYLDGKKKSARVVKSFDPSALVNWIWKPKMGTVVNTGIGFRSNNYSSSALNWYQAADPRPDYYRYLPSYYKPPADPETDPDLYAAQLAQYDTYTDLWRHDKHFRQINWDALYQANWLNRDLYDRNPELKGQSTYILERRHSNFTSWMFNSYVNSRLNDYMQLQAGVSFNYTDAHYYKTIDNLLGGEFWRDVDNFAERDFPDNPEILQNDLRNPNRKVTDGDKFGYDYNIRSYLAKAWIQNQINTMHWDVNYGLEMSYTNFMRHGNMQNGRAPENSLGSGKRHTFDNAAFKAGATYKLNGRNYFAAHFAYGTRAPLPDYAYVSPRIKDTSVTGLKSERFLSADIAYIWNYNNFRGSIGGFYTEMWDGIKRSGFYDYQLNTFMNYAMSGIQTRYTGLELGFVYKFTPSLSLTGAGTIAQYTYRNNPLGVRSYENGSQEDVSRRVYLKGFHLGGTPQQAYSLGLDYAAPGMWFFGINANYFADGYVDLAPTRHEAMPELYTVVKPAEGQTIQQAVEQKIEEIAHQDKLKDAFTLNVSIGKVIYTRWGSLNFNLSVNNVLNNRKIQTGGYQEGKFDYENYSTTKFPNKIYYAQGIRVFFNFGIRF